MAYFNRDNFDSPSSAPEEFDSDPFLWRQTLAAKEEVHQYPAPTFASGWTTQDQHGSVTNPSTSLPVTAGYGEYISILPSIFA